MKGINTAVAKEMAHVNERLFNNPYFRSIDALLALASYRFSSLIEWLPMVLIFISATLIDGFFLRIVKAKEFIQHNPEVFALHACTAIITVCAAILVFVMPIMLNPLLLPAIPIAIGIFVSCAVANFHRRS